jgi:hypothetical protein
VGAIRGGEREWDDASLDVRASSLWLVSLVLSRVSDWSLVRAERMSVWPEREFERASMALEVIRLAKELAEASSIE